MSTIYYHQTKLHSVHCKTNWFEQPRNWLYLTFIMSLRQPISFSVVLIDLFYRGGIGSVFAQKKCKKVVDNL